MDRVIFHCDLNCFYASVELLSIRNCGRCRWPWPVILPPGTELF